MTSGPDPGELPGFWGSMVFRHDPIPRKGSGKQQQQQREKKDVTTLSKDKLFVTQRSAKLCLQKSYFQSFN